MQKVAAALIRYGGVVMLVLGIAFWTGHADGLVVVHMLLGILIVVALWLLAGVEWLSPQPRRPLAASAVVLGLVLALVGLNQKSILTGSNHWIIQIIHLALGLSVIGMGEMLNKRRALEPRPYKAPATQTSAQKALGQS